MLGSALYISGSITDAFIIYYKDNLVNYADEWNAAEDLAGGHTFAISSGIDTSTLGIPEVVGDWEKVRIDKKDVHI